MVREYAAQQLRGQLSPSPATGDSCQPSPPYKGRFLRRLPFQCEALSPKGSGADRFMHRLASFVFANVHNSKWVNVLNSPDVQMCYL